MLLLPIEQADAGLDCLRRSLGEGVLSSDLPCRGGTGGGGPGRLLKFAFELVSKIRISCDNLFESIDDFA
jgi:hypothetical protein